MVENRVPGSPALPQWRSLGLASHCRSPAVTSSSRHGYAPIGICQQGWGDKAAACTGSAKKLGHFVSRFVTSEIFIRSALNLAQIAVISFVRLTNNLFESFLASKLAAGYFIMYCRHTSFTGCVQDTITANGQQGLEAINYTGGKCTCSKSGVCVICWNGYKAQHMNVEHLRYNMLLCDSLHYR